MKQFIVLAIISLFVPESYSKSIEWYEGMQSDSHSWYGDLPDEQPRQMPTGCGGKRADVYFIMDTSSDVTNEQFTKQREFAQKLVHLFYMNQDTVRIGVVSYGEKVKMITPAGEFNQHHQIRDVLDVVPAMGGKRDSGAALNYLRNKVFTPESTRPDVGHVVIMFTNGYSKNSKSTAMNAKLLRAKGVYVYTVSVGPKMDKRELTSIASSPSSSFVFSDDDLPIAESLIELLRIKECDYQVSPPFEGERKVCSAKRPAEMVFGVEHLGLGTRHASEVLSFVYDLLREFDTNGNMKTSVVLSKTTNYPKMGKRPVEVDTLKQQLEDLSFPDLADLLKRVRRSMSKSGKDMAKTAVIFVDDNVTLTKKAFIEAKRNKWLKIETYVIYVGEKYARSELELIANGYKGENVIVVPSYEELLNTKLEILQKICQGL